MVTCGIFTLVTLLTASIMQCAKIHEQMTDEEIANFFHTSPNNVPEYDVVTVRHNLYKRASSNLQLEFIAFGEQINAYLEPSKGVLATTNTPVWLAFIAPNGTVEYKKLHEEVVGRMEQFHHYGVKVSSLIGIRERNERASFEGTVHGMKIRSLPKRFRPALKSRREIKSPKKSRTLVETHHHVIMKSLSLMNENEKLSNSGRQIPKTRILAESTHSKSKRSTQDTVYPSILITTDYQQSQKTLDDLAYYDEIIYQLAFWNAVDLRFRHVDNPQIRLHIAGIIIGLDRRAAPYLNKYRNGHEITIHRDLLEIMIDWSRMEKPSALSRLHYDIVAAMTDNDIIQLRGSNPPKPILGMASYGTLCSPGGHMIESLAIIQDKGGFRGIITAAHELGHILGVLHDGEVQPGDHPADKCNEAQGFIMTAPRKPGPENLKWSQCSLSRLSNFLRHREINCVDKLADFRDQEPISVPDPVPIRRLLPGDIADTHKQCQGRGYTWACDTHPNICSNMQCYYTGWMVFSYGWWCKDAGPAIEGTSCSPGHKCLDGVCQCFTDECLFNKTQSIV